MRSTCMLSMQKTCVRNIIHTTNKFCDVNNRALLRHHYVRSFPNGFDDKDEWFEEKRRVDNDQLPFWH